MNWMDGGRLFFFIRKEALAKEDFSKVVISTNTH